MDKHKIKNDPFALWGEMFRDQLSGDQTSGDQTRMEIKCLEIICECAVGQKNYKMKNDLCKKLQLPQVDK